MPPTIHRSERICIDISDNVVSIIKLDPEGVMMRAGSAKAPTMPQVPDDAYVTDLSAAIRKAAWAAKVSAGFGASCIVVSGMPDMTMQRFSWPDIPVDAIDAIAQEEIMPYLPGSASHFTVGCEVLKQSQGSGGTDMIEVLVAAMPIEHASAITTACKWANFKPKRLELRENARGRLAHYWCAPVEGEVPTTYAILDVGPGMANISFYQNGMFHSNRYFPPEMVKLNQVDDFELLMSVKTGGVDDNENTMRYVPEKLTEDIVSAVGHFHRMVGGTKISCVLLMDEENIPGIEESLRGNLGLPVLKPSQWVSPGLKRPNLRRIEQAQFLDAFAAGMPSLSNHGGRMDLRMDASAADITGLKPEHAKAGQTTNTTIPAGPVPGVTPVPIVSPIPPPAVVQPIVHPIVQPIVQEEPVFPQISNPKKPIDDLFTPKVEPAPLGFDNKYNEKYDDLYMDKKSNKHDDPYPSRQSDLYDDPFPTRGMDSYDDPYHLPKSDSYDDPYHSSKADSYDDPYHSSKADSYDDPYRLPKPDSYDDPYHSSKPDPYDEPYLSRQPDPLPLGDPFPARPVESMPSVMDDLFADPDPIINPTNQAKSGHHEFPFDPIKAQPDDTGGFPYAIPEDPKPPRSFKAIVAAFALVVVIVLVAVLIPLQETLRLRSELQYLNNSIAAHVSVDAIIMLEQERGEANRQIQARRQEVSQINERMGIVREFYMLLPAMIMIPEVLENAGIQVDAVVANDNNVVVSGRTNQLLSLVHASRYLRGDLDNSNSPFAHLFDVSFDTDEVDGFAYYTFTITVRPNNVPFWLHGQIERSWQ